MPAQNATEQFERAAALDATGQIAAASAAYMAILHDVPDHAGTLNNFGALLCRTGHRSAARTVFAQAAACHPDQPAGHVNLANLLREDGAPGDARAHYEAALRCAPGCVEAHQGLGHVFAALGDPVRAAAHQALGWRTRVFTPWRYRGARRPVRVLLLTSVVGGNIPVRGILDDRVFAVTAVALEFFDPAMPLPPHDVVLNAAGDADSCDAALQAAERLVSGAPVLNLPAAVRATARVANASRLGCGPGITCPRMALVSRRGDLAGALRQFGFPLLLRAPGFHTGQHFVRVDAAEGVAAALAGFPGGDVLAIAPLPATGPDGMARKYRVMIVGGRLYPLHLAISPDWKVHYFTAAMAEQPAFREEERRFLTSMDAVLGPLACAALRWIADTLALDYAGVDFAIGPDGGLLLFEANATMALVPPPPEPMWDYRRAAYAAALAAAQALVRGHPRAAGD